jgi:hypothetical protein
VSAFSSFCVKIFIIEELENEDIGILVILDNEID